MRLPSLTSNYARRRWSILVLHNQTKNGQELTPRGAGRPPRCHHQGRAKHEFNVRAPPDRNHPNPKGSKKTKLLQIGSQMFTSPNVRILEPERIFNSSTIQEKPSPLRKHVSSTMAYRNKWKGPDLHIIPGAG